MKHFKYTLFTPVFLLFFILSCSKQTEAPSTRSIILQGKWRVVLFSDNGLNETSNYSGINFTFQNNGVVTASSNSGSLDGTWSTGADENNNRLSLGFNSIALNDLNLNWTFTEKSYSLVKLEFVNPGNGGVDILVLQKIR